MSFAICIEENSGSAVANYLRAINDCIPLKVQLHSNLHANLSGQNQENHNLLTK